MSNSSSNHPSPKAKNSLRLLHTSDWHIGKRLHNEARYEEFAEFLAWILASLKHHQVDVLVVAGDVFDTMTPSNKAQELYYDFLGQLHTTQCRHVIIVAGNHDSPSFLEAPKSLLKSLDIHIIGTPSAVEQDCLVLSHQGVPELIVACVPYLRDKDVRTSTLGESLEQKTKNTALGIAQHYAHLAKQCHTLKADIQQKYNKHVPMIATGHLFAVGATHASVDDGMRDLYVGTLGAVSADSFTTAFDYVALGHIHAQQSVGKKSHIRYSGSPMAMGFGEVGQTKYVLLVDFVEAQAPVIEPLAVPIFRPLHRIHGNLNELEQRIHQLASQPQQTQFIDGISISPKQQWLEVTYTGRTQLGDLSERIQQMTQGTSLLAINIKNQRLQESTLNTLYHDTPTINSLSPSDVFDRLLSIQPIDDVDKNSLMHAHAQLLKQLDEEDVFKE